MAGWDDLRRKYGADQDDLADFVRERDRGRSYTRNTADFDDLEDDAHRFYRKYQRVDADESICARMQAILDKYCTGSRDDMRDGHYAAVCSSLVGHIGLATVLATLSEFREGRPGHARDVRRSIEGAYKKAMTARDATEPECACPGTFEVIRPNRPEVLPEGEEDGGDDESDASEARYADLDMDLTAYLDGDVEPLPTDRGLVRNDGVPLLYAGLTHMAVGETEAGKSWLALACAMTEMRAGHRVLYVHFEESDPRGTVLRLRQMGARREWFAAGLFRFAGIELPLAADRVANLVEHRPDLAILDGVNAAMALHGMNPDKADEYGAWDQRLARPLAATGAATLSLDHVVKNPEAAQRGYAGGTVMKLNLISGASFLLENRDPLRPGAKGATSIYVAKDRPGSLRAIGEVKSGRRALLGTFWVDSTSALTICSWTAPVPTDDPAERDRRGAVDGEAIRVLRVLIEMIDEEGRDPERAPSAREIRVRPGGFGFRKDSTVIAGHLDTLVAHGLITNTVAKGTPRWEPTEKGRKAALPDGTKPVEDL